MSFSRGLLMLLRIGAGFQVIVGIALWTGNWYSVRGLHIMVGLAFVVLLWVLALTAIVKRRTIGLALFALLWGFAIAAFGMIHQGILVGELHWVSQALHLVMGLAAMLIAERLAPKTDAAPRAVSVPS